MQNFEHLEENLVATDLLTCIPIYLKPISNRIGYQGETKY
jgi:hypothetical protein